MGEKGRISAFGLDAVNRARFARANALGTTLYSRNVARNPIAVASVTYGPASA